MAANSSCCWLLLFQHRYKAANSLQLLTWQCHQQGTSHDKHQGEVPGWVSGRQEGSNLHTAHTQPLYIKASAKFEYKGEWLSCLYHHTPMPL
jgi:hypothetical protein